MKASTSVARDNLLHVGTCIGKFTKSGKFRLHITALEYLSQYAKVRLTEYVIELWTLSIAFSAQLDIFCSSFNL